MNAGKASLKLNKSDENINEYICVYSNERMLSNYYADKVLVCVASLLVTHTLTD